MLLTTRSGWNFTWKDDDPHHADHGNLLRESMRTTLVIAGPSVEPGRVGAPVRTIDILPTVLDLTGVRHDAAALDGRSLAGYLR